MKEVISLSDILSYLSNGVEVLKREHILALQEKAKEQYAEALNRKKKHMTVIATHVMLEIAMALILIGAQLSFMFAVVAVFLLGNTVLIERAIRTYLKQKGTTERMRLIEHSLRWCEGNDSCGFLENAAIKHEAVDRYLSLVGERSPINLEVFVIEKLIASKPSPHILSLETIVRTQQNY